jgi:hypothetical protein
MLEAIYLNPEICVMNHPKPEEWTPYLFGEAKPNERRRLTEHLESCAECRDELAAWKHTLGRLDAWKLPRLRRAAPAFAPLLKWAFAAACLTFVAFGAGRLTAARTDAAHIRAAIEPELRAQLRQEFTRMLREQIDASSDTTLAAAGKQSEEVAASWFLSLKKDLDVIAVNTAVGLRQTEQQIVQLADYRGPVSSSQSPRN